MNTHRRLRIALLTQSTNPRGGVVHALQLGEALTDLGHDVVVHAPDPRKEGFFRKVRCGTALVPARPVKGDLGALVATRIEEYVRYLSRRDTPAFDVYHAHDGIGANALATLAEWGRIPGFVRTVHHLDTFQDDAVEAKERVQLLQDAIAELPPKCRQVFLLHKFMELSHAEISGRLGISKNMVEKHVMKAMTHCRRRVEDVKEVPGIRAF